MTGVDTKQQQQQRKEKVNVGLVLLPFPGMGHLMAMVELAKYILLQHNRDPDHHFFVTVLNIPPEEPTPQISSYISSVAADSGGNICFCELPKLDKSLVPDITNRSAFLSTLMEFEKPHVRSTIRNILLSSPVAALIVDMFCIDMIDVADELGVPSYVFFTSGATSLAFMLYMPTLDAVLPTDKDMEELQDEGATIDLPGFSCPIPPMVLPDPLLHRKEWKHVWLMYVASRFVKVKGFIINSYLELQPQKFKALEESVYLPGHPTPPVYPVGPMLSLNLNATSNVDGTRHECLQWLDGQPAGSVVFLCLGSRGSLSKKQATEVAIALERSGHRFLWVLRSPPPEHLKRISRLPIDTDLEEVLPEGFLERTKNSGMIWPTFAPQTAILSHKALGGFVTHCGWNSILESLWCGVPMLAWPLYSEQHSNAFEMFTEMGIAMELKIDRRAENWATADEIERAIRCLMDADSSEQSRAVRSKVMEMSERGKEALREGGSSFRSMQKLTKLLLSNTSPQSQGQGVRSQ